MLQQNYVHPVLLNAIEPFNTSHHKHQPVAPSRAVAGRVAGRTGVGLEATQSPLQFVPGSLARPSPTRASPDYVLSAAPPYSDMDTRG